MIKKYLYTIQYAILNKNIKYTFGGSENEN